jgi:hypothetical protein
VALHISLIILHILFLCLLAFTNIRMLIQIFLLSLLISQHLICPFGIYITRPYWSRGSSVSIVSDYGLDDRTIEVRSPAEANDISSSLCVQTGSGVHPASCTMCTGGPFPRGKARPGRYADYSPPSSAEVVNE